MFSSALSRNPAANDLQFTGPREKHNWTTQWVTPLEKHSLIFAALDVIISEIYVVIIALNESNTFVDLENESCKTFYW